MDKSQKHIINKVFLEVHTNSSTEAYHLKDNLDVFLKEQALPYLEAYFNEFQQKLPAKSNLQIEKIALNLSLDRPMDFDQLKVLIKKGVMKELEQKRFTNAISSEERLETKLLHFFKMGSVPWWSDSNALTEFYNEEMVTSLLNSNELILKLLRSLHQDLFRERLIKQLDDNQLFELYKSFVGLTIDVDTSIRASTINDLVSIIKTDNSLSDSFLLVKRYLVWEIALGALIKIDKTKLKSKLFIVLKLLRSHTGPSAKNKGESIKNSVSKLINSKNSDKLLRALTGELSKDIEELRASSSIIKKDSKKERLKTDHEIFESKEVIKDKRSLTHSDDEFILPKENAIHEPTSNYYVENAGLILLHPYLKQLLLNCKLLDGDEIARPEIAAHLLHFIATNQEKQYEYQMVFEKFLCNIPLEKPINRNIRLSSDLKLQAEEMLRSVLKNWPEMKNASLELLRNEYLQRPGKLVLTQENPKVIVERKTQDILLEKLPWNIGLCKLPWKNKIVFTDW